ncbi:MAG: hypothetical protein JRD89_19205 [Deltaproteobacteria bacterium]|nr:hypothetical protein [Deltaproteobacteria bacterium]
MATKIELAKDKWVRKLKAGIPKWLVEVVRAESYDAFVRGLSSASGIPESTIRGSIVASEWKKFQEEVSRSPEAFRRKFEAIATPEKSEKWLRAFKTALTTAA